MIGNADDNMFDSSSGDGGSCDADSSGNASCSADEATGLDNAGKSEFPPGFDGPNSRGDGVVYPDNDDPATKIVKLRRTANAPCDDLDIYFYMVGLLGQKANYSLVFQNCRDFSDSVFRKFDQR